MRRSLLAIAVMLMALVGLPATAAAGRPAPAPKPATITAVTPSTTFTTGVDDCGVYRLYDAAVTLSWTRSIRLEVALVEADGTRLPPGTVTLSGTGSRTVTVHGVVVPLGATGYFVAEASTFSRKTGYQVVARLPSTEIVSFPATA